MRQSRKTEGALSTQGLGLGEAQPLMVSSDIRECPSNQKPTPNAPMNFDAQLANAPVEDMLATQIACGHARKPP